jgi:hemerythrin-like domain-containing protein
MTAIDILRNEHALILEAMELLERHARRVAAGAALDAGFARWVLEFLREFADDTHHAKEEGVLFGLLERRGLLPGPGALAGMLAEHEASRAQADRLERDLAAGDAAAFAGTALALAAQLRRHVLREDEDLFRRIAPQLGAADDVAALEAFGRVVHERAGVLTRQRHLAAIERWRAVIGRDGAPGD